MKKLLALILSTVLVLTAVPAIPASAGLDYFADYTLTTELSDDGATLSASLDLSGNDEGLWAAVLLLSFNTEALEIASIEKGPVWTDVDATFTAKKYNTTNAALSKYNGMLYMDAGMSMTGEHNFGNGNVVTVTFNILDDSKAFDFDLSTWRDDPDNHFNENFNVNLTFTYDGPANGSGVVETEPPVSETEPPVVTDPIETKPIDPEPPVSETEPPVVTDPIETNPVDPEPPVTEPDVPPSYPGDHRVDYTLTAESSSDGSTLTATLDLSGNEDGLWAAVLLLSFNTEALEIASIEKGPVWTDVDATFTAKKYNTTNSALSQYNGMLYMDAGMSATGEHNFGNGNVVTVTFNILDDSKAFDFDLSIWKDDPDNHFNEEFNVDLTFTYDGPENGYVSPATKGDINGDGMVNLIDMFNLKLFVKFAAEPTETERLAADINGDGAINALDSFEMSYRIAYGEWRQ